MRLRLPSIFRWRYLAPRLGVVLVAALVVRFLLDPLLRKALVAGGEAAVGAKVEVADLRTSLREGRMIVAGVAVANPQKPMRNLAEASQIRLELDVAELLRKRLVVHDGSIAGLKFDSPRTTSGELEKAPADGDETSALDPVLAAAQQTASQWFDDLAGRVEQDLTDSLATPRVLDDLEKRWPEQCQALKNRAETLRTKSKRIESTFREAKKNPLRNLQQIEQLKQELAATEAELRATIADIEALPQQAQTDRQTIDVARKRDEQFLREHLQLANVDADQLNQYLLGQIASDYLEQTAWWIRQARKFVPKRKMDAPERTRGVTVLFAARRRPACLIERVELTGDGRVDGQPFAFTGVLTDAASEPELHDRPLRLCIQGRGAFEGIVTAEFDRRCDMPRDTLTVDMPKLALSERTLGRADKLAVAVAAGEASLQANVLLEGDRLSGVVKLKQSSRLTAAAPMLRDDRIAAVLHESLAGVDRLEATIHLAGTLKRPSVKIDSNVGPQLASGVSGAVRKYLADRQERLLAKLKGRVDQQLAKLETHRLQAQRELTAALGENQRLVGQIAGLMGGQTPLPAVDAAKIGAAIKLDKLKR